MRFTEYELTAALTGAAKSVMATRRSFRKRGSDIDSAWDATDRYERFKLLDSLGSQVLPVLVALPDVEVEPGTRPTFSDEQVREAIEEQMGDGLGKVRRAVVVKGRTALVKAALANVPVRLDPDGLLRSED